jgi:hypothetical protein
VFRFIHKIHEAAKPLAQSRFTGESRCPRQNWIPAFAGKARKEKEKMGSESIFDLRIRVRGTPLLREHGGNRL